MRRAVSILALVVFGMAVQTVVAYALAFRAWEVHDDPWPNELMMGGWPGPVPEEWVGSDGGIVVHPQRRFSNASVAWDWQNFQGSDDREYHELNVWRMGWPLRSMAAYRHGSMPVQGRVFREPKGWRAAWVLAWMKGYVQPPAKPGDPPRVWPLYPIWSGLAVNTLLYATAAWVALWAWAQVRQWRRKSRGLCVRCRYEVAGLGRCPECGAIAAGKGDAERRSGKEAAGPSSDDGLGHSEMECV